MVNHYCFALIKYLYDSLQLSYFQHQKYSFKKFCERQSKYFESLGVFPMVLQSQNNTFRSLFKIENFKISSVSDLSIYNADFKNEYFSDLFKWCFRNIFSDVILLICLKHNFPFQQNLKWVKVSHTNMLKFVSL